MAVFATAFALESALYSTLAALLPHYEREFDLSAFGSGILAGCYSGGMVLGILIAGLWLSDRFGVQRAAVAGCAMLAVASVGFGAAAALPALELARLVQGIGAGIVWCSLLNWLIALVPAPSRGAALGAAMGAGVFGMAAGPILGAATKPFGTFGVFAAVSVAFVVYGAVLLRIPSPHAIRREERTRLRLPSDPVLRRVAALVTIPPLVAGGAITIVPLHLSDLGATEVGIDAALLAGALLSAACCIYAGTIADRRGHLAPVLFGAVATAATLLVMAAFESVLVIALAFVLFESVGLGFFWIPLMSLFTERGEQLEMDPAAVALLLNLAITLAYTFGPPVVTGVQEAAGVSAAYLSMVGMTLAAMAGLWSRQVRRRARAV
ncbi:MAG: MFS transporter [Actinobacteria bacterium]|nr:MFS transporter [Actinomycetota bacterium]